MPKTTAPPRPRCPRWAMTPEAMSTVPPGIGTPALSNNTPRKTITYPYWPIRERIWSTACKVRRFYSPVTRFGSRGRVAPIHRAAAKESSRKPTGSTPRYLTRPGVETATLLPSAHKAGSRNGVVGPLAGADQSAVHLPVIRNLVFAGLRQRVGVKEHLYGPGQLAGERVRWQRLQLACGPFPPSAALVAGLRRIGRQPMRADVPALQGHALEEDHVLGVHVRNVRRDEREHVFAHRLVDRNPGRVQVAEVKDDRLLALVGEGVVRFARELVLGR